MEGVPENNVNNMQLHRPFEQTVEPEASLSSTDLRLVELSLRLMSGVANIAGEEELGTALKQGMNFTRWVQGVKLLKSGQLAKGLESPITGSNKEAATFFGSVMASISLLTTPLSYLKENLPASDQEDTIIGELASHGYDLKDSELKNLSKMIKTLKPGVKSYGALAAIEKVRNLSSEDSVEMKRDSYLQMVKSVSDVAKLAATVMGYGTAAEVLGVVAASCGIVRLFNPPTTAGHKDSFSSLQKEVERLIKQQLEKADIQVSERIEQETDPFIIDMLKEIQEELKLDERSYLKFLHSAEDSGYLVEIVESFNQGTVQTLEANGVYIDGDACQALGDKCKTYQQGLEEKQVALNDAVNEALVQLENDEHEVDEGFVQIQSLQLDKKISAIGARNLIKRLTVLRGFLFSQKEELKKLAEVAVSTDAEKEQWQKAVTALLTSDEYTQTHQMTSLLQEQIPS